MILDRYHTLSLSDLRRLVSQGRASALFVGGRNYSSVFRRFAREHGSSWDVPTLRLVHPSWMRALERAARLDAKIAASKVTLDDCICAQDSISFNARNG
jgi:hypothetical protein